jgi:PEP-CTERM motif
LIDCQIKLINPAFYGRDLGTGNIMGRSISSLCGAAAVLLLPSLASAQIDTNPFHGIVIVTDRNGISSGYTYDDFDGGDLLGLPFDLTTALDVSKLFGGYLSLAVSPARCHDDTDPFDCLFSDPVADHVARKLTGDREDENLANSSDSLAAGIGGVGLQPSYYIETFSGLGTLEVFLHFNFPSVAADLFQSLPPAPVTTDDATFYGQPSAPYGDGVSTRISGDGGYGGHGGYGGFVDPPAVTVPEPSTWALAVIGFAGVGVATMRRRSIKSDPFA